MPRSARLLAALALVAAYPPLAGGQAGNALETPGAAAEAGVTPDAPPATPAGRAAIEAGRAEAYERFRGLVAEGRYAEAVPSAREVLRLTEALDPNHEDLPTAWNNLGVAQLRAADPKAALESFAKALDILEGTRGIGSRRLIAPMAGLGAAHVALGQPALAAESFERAIAVSRRASGLFNLEQLDLMDSLIQAYSAVGFTEGIDRERRYALTIVERRYGYGDPRAMPRLTQLADWYEATGRHAPARALYKRMLDIASREDGGRNTATVTALLAIARTHRLQFAEDPESLVQPTEVTSALGDPMAALQGNRVETAAPGAAVQTANLPRARLDPEGARALSEAIELLEASPDPPAGLMSRALLEQADWLMTAGQTDEALLYYRRAWPLLESLAAQGAANPLASPRRLLYRPPQGQRRSRLLTGSDVVERRGEFVVTLDARGKPVGVEAAGSSLSEAQADQIARALRRAIYSPAYEAGEAVAGADLRLSESWFDRSADVAPAPEDGEPDAPGGASGDASGVAGAAPSGGGPPASSDDAPAPVDDGSAEASGDPVPPAAEPPPPAGESPPGGA